MPDTFGQWGQETTLFEAPLPGGGRLSLIQSEDDICIKRDGALVAGCFWRPSQLRDAIAEFRFLTRQLENPAAPRPQTH